AAICAERGKNLDDRSLTEMRGNFLLNIAQRCRAFFDRHLGKRRTNRRATCKPVLQRAKLCGGHIAISNACKNRIRCLEPRTSEAEIKPCLAGAAREK